MTVAPAESPAPPQLLRCWRAVVLVDVFESTRLTRECPDDYADRWMRFLDEVRRELIPACSGRWVRSTGDGFLLDFEQASSAAAAALDIQRRVQRYNLDRAAARAIVLRIGVAAGEVAVMPLDLIGHVVDIAHRLTTISRPGEVTATAEIHDQLVIGLDADVEDLGDVYLRHVDGPVRAFRLGPPAPSPLLDSLVQRRRGELRPGLAVLPFECQLGYDPEDMLGEALADEVITQLARCADLNVISGLSSRRLKRRGLALRAAADHLDAAFVLSGAYRMTPGGVALNVQLQETRTAQVLTALHYETTVQAAFDPADPLADRIVGEVGAAIFRQALKASGQTPLPALESYTLLWGAIGLMHRATAREFDRAREMLEHLAQRQGRHGIAEAWLAKWHVLRVVQGWAPHAEQESRAALDHVRRSLDINPSNALALSIGGLVHGYLLKDLNTAGHMYQRALDDNRSEPLAWLFSATRHAYLGQGADAEAAAAMALRLSPIDPLRYFFDSLASSAVAGNCNWAKSTELAQRSLRANRTHASTWRTLAYALVMQDRVDEARQAVQSLLAIEPGLTISGFRQRFPGRDGPMAEPWAAALKLAGVPD